jgi:hypothetical protein
MAEQTPTDNQANANGCNMEGSKQTPMESRSWNERSQGELYRRFFGSPLLSIQDAIFLVMRHDAVADPSSSNPEDLFLDSRLHAPKYLKDSTFIPPVLTNLICTDTRLGDGERQGFARDA